MSTNIFHLTDMQTHESVAVDAASVESIIAVIGGAFVVCSDGNSVQCTEDPWMVSAEVYDLTGRNITIE